MEFIEAVKLAEKWGYNDSYIRREIKAGRLTGQKVGKTWLVLKDETFTQWEANPRRQSRSNKG